MNALDKILVPVDGSELSERILMHVRRLLLRSDAEVTLLRIVPPGTSNPDKETARGALERLAEGLEGQGARVHFELREGDPASAIAEFAAKYRPSLIAMATHGRTGIARWTRGSTAERVLRTATSPLLLANPFGLGDRDELRFKRILVPLDGSDGAARVLPLVRALGSLYESEVILHMTVPTQLPVEFPNPVLMVTSEDALEILREHEGALAGLRVRLSADHGAAAESILDLAAREKVDLIAMTTHGRSGVRRWAYGSVAEHVLRHAGCPLLVQRTTDPDDMENPA